MQRIVLNPTTYTLRSQFTRSQLTLYGSKTHTTTIAPPLFTKSSQISSSHTRLFSTTLNPHNHLHLRYVRQQRSTLQTQQRSKFSSTTNQNNNQNNIPEQSIKQTTTSTPPPVSATAPSATTAQGSTTVLSGEAITSATASTTSSTTAAAAAEMSTLPTRFPNFSSVQEFIKWYLVDPPTYQRYSPGWWLSNSWLMLMYSVTGYSALLLVRKFLSLFGIENTSLFRGEPKHRLIYFLMMTPMYSFLTYIYGFVFGRPVYGARMVRRIWGRFLPWLREKK